MTLFLHTRRNHFMITTDSALTGKSPAVDSNVQLTYHD